MCKQWPLSAGLYLFSCTMNNNNYHVMLILILLYTVEPLYDGHIGAFRLLSAIQRLPFIGRVIAKIIVKRHLLDGVLQMNIARK